MLQKALERTSAHSRPHIEFAVGSERGVRLGVANLALHLAGRVRDRLDALQDPRAIERDLSHKTESKLGAQWCLLHCRKNGTGRTQIQRK